MYVEMDTHANLQADSFDVSLLWYPFVGPTGVWQLVSWSSRPTLDANTLNACGFHIWLKSPALWNCSVLLPRSSWSPWAEFATSQLHDVVLIRLIMFNSFCSGCRREVLPVGSLSTKKLLRCSLRYYVVCYIQRPVRWNFQAELIPARTFGPWCSWQFNQTWQIRIFLPCASRLFNSQPKSSAKEYNVRRTKVRGQQCTIDSI